jgi:5'-3' exoribonuclease 1
VKALGALKRPEYNYGRPFNPFQQLLSVMPASSAKLFPQVYQELILNQNSPLRTPIDYFPTEFDLDMEGKRADWEGIVLIPFIDEKVLLEAERTHINVARLRKEELERNSHGPVLTFYYDQKSNENLFCQSTIPSQFTNITSSKSRVMMVAPPPPFPANEKGFTATIQPGTTMGLQNPVGYPTMGSLKVTSRLDSVGVNVFGMASKKKSLVLESQAPSLGNIQLQQIGQALLGERCFIDWPYLNESTICALSDKTGYWDNRGFKPHSGGSFSNWEDKADRCVERYLTKYAVDIGESSFFVHVRDCIDMTSMPDGSIKKEFSDAETMHPIQVILRSNPFERRGKGSLQTETQKKLLQSLKPGSKVLYLSEPYYGCVATVLKGNSKAKKGAKGAKLNIQLVPTPDAEKSNRVTAKRMMTNFPTRYLPDGFLVKKLGISYRVLGMITGMVNAKDSQKNNVGLGLSLKSRSQNAIVPDYARVVQRGENFGYEYSNATFQILKQYKQKFPWVFDAIGKEGKKDYLGVDFFGKVDPEEADKRLYAVRTWLKTLPVSRRPMVKQEAKMAAEDSIRALQQALVPTAVSASHSKPIHLEDVQLMNLLTPADPSLPRPYILKVGTFDLGDRVASVGGHANAAPFGCMGSVVGIYPNGLVEVVFDTEYLGGKDLYGRCKNGTGNIVPPFCLLNTTKPINTQTLTQTRQANLKAKKADERKREIKTQQQQQKQQTASSSSSSGGGGKKNNRNNAAKKDRGGAPKVDDSVTVTRPKPQPPKKEAMGKALLNMLQQKPQSGATTGGSSSSSNANAESVQVNAGMELLKMLQNTSLAGGDKGKQ